MKHLFGLILILFFSSSLFSQNSWLFMPSVKYGFLLPHKPSLSYFNDSHLNEITLEVSKQLTDTNKWHKYYRYPNIGGGIYFTDLPSDFYTGKSLAGYGFIDIPLKWHKKYSFNYTIGAGVAYLTKHFDETDNYYNIAIGSTLNAFINIGFQYAFYFNKIQLNTGLSFTHYSNGAWKKPNLGFNIPTIKLGVGFLSNQKNVFIKKSLNQKIRQTEWNLMLAGGTRQNYPSDPNRYYVGTLAFMYEKQFSMKHKWGIGLDLFYDPSIPNRNKEMPDYSEKNIYFRSGVRLSHDLIFGKTSFTFQAGCYYFDKYSPDGSIYSRLGLRYKINHWLQANVLLKTHFFKADVIEFGLSLYKKKGSKAPLSLKIF